MARKTRDIFKLLELLEPVDMVGVGKVRIGNNADGGYVLPDNLIPGQAVYSYGIGSKASFDRDLAERGHQIYMFDHTVQAAPGEHANYHFHREGVTHEHTPKTRLFTMAQHLERLGHDRDVLLKMDVEGAEWDVFAEVDAKTLGCFSHIAMELHEIDRIVEDAFYDRAWRALRNIRSQFSLVHVHANNAAPLSLAANLTVANTLELTFVRTTSVRTAPSRTLYPTCFDYPNMRKEPDHLLWFYPFAPQPELPPQSHETCLELAQARASVNVYYQQVRSHREAAAAAAAAST